MSVTTAPPRHQPPVPPGPPLPPSAPPPADLPTEVPRGGLVKRAALGCLIVLLAAMGTGAILANGEVATLQKDLNINPSLKVASGTLTPASFGGPQTLLLVGDDTRKVFKYYRGNVPDLANEMLLVRLDPSKPWISMMSIPRELWVTIYPPGRRPYTNRLNSAYTFGVNTLVSTIKHVTGLSINHVVVITFDRFQRAVNEMGCVYSTADRRYYHANVPGGEQYQEIDLQPGYQQMCGSAAEQFVSYRHGDTSLVRDARDQSFLLDVKKQYGSTLADPTNVHKFEKIFGEAVLTDPVLHSRTGILDLLGTLISSSGRRVRQVHFQANLLPSYDTATPQQIAASVHSFLFGGSSIPSARVAAVAHAVHNSKHVTATLPLLATPDSELADARTADARFAFTMEYPRVQDRGGSGVAPYLRNYLIYGPNGQPNPAFVEVFSAGQLGQFYDVQGTTWTTAPQFSSPEQTLQIGSRTYQLYYEAESLKMVAWQEHGAIYWIRNSLNDTLSNGEMLAIAEQTTPLFAGQASGAPRNLHLTPVALPTRPSVTIKTTTAETIGSIGGLLTLGLVPLLMIPLFRRYRTVRELRGVLRANLEVETRLTAYAQAVGAPRYVKPIAAPTYPTAGYSRYRARPAPPRRLPRPVVVTVVLLIAAGAAAWLLLGQGSGHSPTAQRTARRASSPQVPATPVEVLNASAAQGAAARMAKQLHGWGVRVAGIGDVSESRAAGLWVLYAPGQQIEAARLADLLARRIPRIAPIDSTVQAAAGGARLVLVIS